MKKMFFESLREGIEIHKKVKFEEKQINFYINLSRDKNSIHGGPNPVVPGILILFKIAGLVSQKFADKSMVTEIVSSKFKRPLFLKQNAFIILRIKKKGLVHNGRGTIILDIHIRNNRNKLLFVGNSKVRVPLRQTTAIVAK